MGVLYVKDWEFCDVIDLFDSSMIETIQLSIVHG